MRVAIDGRALAEGRQTGVQEYVRQLVRSLREVADETVELVVFISGFRARLSESLPEGVEVVTLRWPNKVLTVSQWLLGWPRWDAVVDADVFLFPNLQLLPLSKSVPIVTVAHDVSFEQFPEFLTLRRRWWHHLVSPRRFFERAEAVVAVSEHTKRDLVGWYGLDEAKIRVIHSGVASPPELPDATAVAAARERYGLPEQYILYLGAMEPRKNIVGVVRAFEEIAKSWPHGLVLAGEYGWRERELTEVIETSAVRERIVRLGVVSEEGKWALYAGASVFVYPSFYEGFGFPPLEALVSGTPVIVSMSSALPEVVGEWAVMVDPQARGQLVLALEEVLAGGAVVSGEVSATVAARYTWERCAREVLAVLSEVYARSR